MNYTAIANSAWMFVWVGLLLLAVIGQCLIFMLRASRHGREIGLTQAEMSKGLITGISISIMPTLPVVLVLLSLTPLLGIPLPWLRLSVIGSAYYETYAASTALECVGESLAVNGYSAYGWVCAAWVMTVGGSACVLWSSLAIRPISVLYKKAEKFDVDLVLAIGSGCLTGIMAYVSVNFGFASLSTNGIVFGISFLVGALLVLLHNRIGKQWMMDYLMSISMVLAMVAACVIFRT